MSIAFSVREKNNSTMYKFKINFKSWVKRAKEKFEDTKGVPDAVNLRYQRGTRCRKSKIPKGYQMP
jgi:hypothetical protein